MFITRLRDLPRFLLDPNELAGGGGPITPTSGEPTPPGAGTGTQTDDVAVNWQERYTEAQAWGTRNAQEAAELRSEAELVRALRGDDEQARLQALQALGFDVAGNDEDVDAQLYDDLPPHVQAKLAKIDELEARWQQQEQTSAQQAEYTAYREMVDPQLAELGIPDGLREIVAEAALELPPVYTPQGQAPDLQGAWNQLQQMASLFAEIPSVQTQVKQAWANTKPQSALTRQGGRGGTSVPEFKDSEARRHWMLERHQANNAL